MKKIKEVVIRNSKCSSDNSQTPAINFDWGVKFGGKLSNFWYLASEKMMKFCENKLLV